MLGDQPPRQRRPLSGGTYVPAILAGLVAAIAGGVAWGLIVKSTDYEIGFAPGASAF